MEPKYPYWFSGVLFDFFSRDDLPGLDVLVFFFLFLGMSILGSSLSGTMVEMNDTNGW